MNYSNESSVILGEAQPQHLSSSNYYQDAQAEGRTAHPTDQVFVYSPIVRIVPDDVPLGIEDPEPHDPLTLADLNYAQRTVFIINVENGNINEDATSYSNDDHNIILPVMQNDNINPIGSIESQDHLIFTFGNDLRQDDEDDDGQTDQTLPPIQDFFNRMQNDIRPNQTNTLDGQSATTAPARVDTSEIEKGIASSIEGAG